MSSKSITGTPTKGSRRTSRTIAHSLLASCLALSASAMAGPLVLEETARIRSPSEERPIQYLWSWADAGYASRIGVFADEIIVSGTSPIPERGSIGYEAWIFKRTTGGHWDAVQNLGYIEREQYFAPPLGLAIDANIAVADAIFERSPTGWTKVASLTSGQDTEISNGLVLNSQSYSGWRASVTGKTTSGWQRLAQLTVPNIYHYDDGEFHGGDVDISGNLAILAAHEGETEPGGDPTPATATIFEAGPTNWTATATLPGTLGEPVAIDNGLALVGSADGAHVFEKAGGNWQLTERLQSANQFARGRLRVAQIKGNLLVLGYTDDDLRGPHSGSLSVWERSAAGAYKEVATLVSSDIQDRMGYDLDIHNRRVVATGKGAAYVWDLPEDFSQPETIQDDFEDGNDAGWMRMAGSTWNVTNTAHGRVYRQSDLAGDAGAYFGSDAWQNQSIETDVTGTAFNGSGRWFGVTVRRKDTANYYYATLRHPNVLSLRKRVNGVYTSLASKSFPIALNRNYRMRLEAVGTRLRLYVDGTLQLEAIDSSLSAGQAGLQLYRASADYDNIVISPNPQVSLYANNFEGSNTSWTHSGNGNWSVVTDGSKVFKQADTQLPIGARAITGVATEDQVLETRVKPTAFDNSANPWFGLVTRYVEDNNYYYVTVRKDGTISLRKLVNGAIQILQTAPLTPSLGRWYTLRMEAVGDALRVYVDGALLLQARDSSYPRGRYGLMTYRTAAEFDDVKVRSP